MSQNDFDTNGPGEEELRDMLRSLPRRDAPGDFEPELMRRVAGIRRRRGLLSVFHTAARADWLSGLASAATGAIVVAATWMLVVSDEPVKPSATSAARSAAADARASSAAPRIDAAPLVIERPPQVPSADTKSAVAPTRTQEPRRSTVSSRRSLGAASSRSISTTAKSMSARTIDTIAATRLRVRADKPAIPTTTEAGVRTAHPEIGIPAPAPTLHGEPTGVDTGGRAR